VTKEGRGKKRSWEQSFLGQGTQLASSWWGLKTRRWVGRKDVYVGGNTKGVPAERRGTGSRKVQNRRGGQGERNFEKDARVGGGER